MRPSMPARVAAEGAARETGAVAISSATSARVDVAPRFRRMALLATVAVVLVGVVFAVVASALAASRGLAGNAVAGIALVVLALVFLVAVGALVSARYGAAIRVLRSRYPNGAVFLA